MAWAMQEYGSYSKVKREETYSSEADTLDATSEDGAKTEKGSYAGRLIYFLLSLNVGLLLVLIIMFAVHWQPHSKKRLLPSPVPEFPREVRTFKLDPLFLSLPTEESNAAWEGLPGPNGRGFINIDPKLGLDLPDTKAGLSVFHQLHCLGALRGFTWDLVYGRLNTTELLKTWPANVTSPTYDQAIHGLWHIAHCFDYLRQGVQCSGDTSLEFVSENTGVAVVDGLDYPHECKSWDAIWSYAKRYG